MSSRARQIEQVEVPKRVTWLAAELDEHAADTAEDLAAIRKQVDTFGEKLDTIAGRLIMVVISVAMLTFGVAVDIAMRASGL